MNKHAFDVHSYRQDFPLLKNKEKTPEGKEIVYFDNAATTLKPQVVVDALRRYYEQETANVHRGVHYLSEISTERYEEAREIVRDFIGANSSKEIIFTRGTTESMNLIAQSYGRNFLNAGDEILISHLEHHSNIVPWQILREQKGIVLKVLPITEQGELALEQLPSLLSEKSKLVSLSAVSNALGTINPLKNIIKTIRAKAPQAKIVVDAAQAVAHLSPAEFNVQNLDCDFLAFSGHKVYGPTGIGVLFGKEKWLNQMPPWQGGGDMISSVSFEKTSWNELPYKFEAGTPSIASAIGLGAALRYYQALPHPQMLAYEEELRVYAETELLKHVPGVRIIGTAKRKCSTISFVLKSVHPHDIGTFTSQEGIAIRTGHHCAQPVMSFFKVPATARASLSFYNTKEEIDRLVEALKKTVEFFQ